MILRLACLSSPNVACPEAAFLAWGPRDMDPNRMHDWKHTTAPMTAIALLLALTSIPDQPRSDVSSSWLQGQELGLRSLSDAQAARLNRWAVFSACTVTTWWPHRPFESSARRDADCSRPSAPSCPAEGSSAPQRNRTWSGNGPAPASHRSFVARAAGCVRPSPATRLASRAPERCQTGPRRAGCVQLPPSVPCVVPSGWPTICMV